MKAERSAEEKSVYHLPDLFQSPCSGQSVVIDASDFSRARISLSAGGQLVVDRFQNGDASCGFLRVTGDHAGRMELTAPKDYGLEACAAGGWLLTPQNVQLPSYWIPQPLSYRRLDGDGHILSQEIAPIIELGMTAAGLRATVEIPTDRYIDTVIWRLSGDKRDLPSDLKLLRSIESQAIFMWSSHTLYQRPADLYAHVIHGHVYENQGAWPHNWRVCSELDAYALYVALNGLGLSTGKRLYSLLKRQVLYSVIARQAPDGGWYHGEWTDGMESHYRLHGAAMHLLTQALEENECSVVRQSLDKAAAFVSRTRGQIDSGVWFLHDSMEQSEKAMGQLPFNWVRTQAFGKSPTNLLVLNTHLDTTIAMRRYQAVTGDAQYSSQVESAAASTRRVLSSQPLESGYRWLYWAIGLTLLPSHKAKRLAFPLRAIKRITWKYFIPQLPRIKARFPRLAMPSGFIERDLSLCGWPDHYQSVTLMDLLRYRRYISDDSLRPVIDRSLRFIHDSAIRQRWMELPDRAHALGFWAEALYRLCMLDRSSLYRSWLAEAILDCADHNIGLSPSLLGGNAEVAVPIDQVPCPSVTDAKLLVANLSRAHHSEFLVVNSSDQPLRLEWDIQPKKKLRWVDQPSANDALEQPIVPARGWVVGQSTNSTS